MSKKLTHQFGCSRMMLPEHRGQLQRHREQTRQREEYRRPLFDEQQQEQFQHALEQSLRHGLPLQVTVVLTGSGRRTFTGTVSRTDPVAGRIFLNTADGILAISTRQIIVIE
ncbi:MAG: YolD-like family protein [Bacillota bacterium]